MNHINVIDSTSTTHRLLSNYYSRQFSSVDNFKKIPNQQEVVEMEILEKSWLTGEFNNLENEVLPKNSAEFKEWYRGVCKESRKESAFLFEFLSNKASLKQMSIYIKSEIQVDGRFDDIIAVSQIGLPDECKMVLANNYWDEMGHGDLCEMHTVLFNKSSQYFYNEDKRAIISDSTLKNGNILMCFANHRFHCGKLLGAITLLEHTAPYRFSSTVKGMKRLGIPNEVAYYHKMHVKIDAKHGKELLQEVLLPLIKQDSSILPEICKGIRVRQAISLEYYMDLYHQMVSQ